MNITFSGHKGYHGEKGGDYNCGKYESIEHIQAACQNDVNCTGYSLKGGQPNCLSHGFGEGDHNCDNFQFFNKN
jgi:hypothetical protein